MHSDEKQLKNATLFFQHVYQQLTSQTLPIVKVIIFQNEPTDKRLVDVMTGLWLMYPHKKHQISTHSHSFPPANTVLPSIAEKIDNMVNLQIWTTEAAKNQANITAMSAYALCLLSMDRYLFVARPGNSDIPRKNFSLIVGTLVDFYLAQ